MLTRSHIVRGPVVCSAHECSQQGRWLLDWSRIGLCVRSLENKCWWWHAWEQYTLRRSEWKGNLGTIDLDGALWIAVVCVGVRPVSVRCAGSVTYSNPYLWCLKTTMRKPTNPAMGTISRMRWPRPAAGWYCAQSGIRGVVNLLGKVPDKQSVNKLECWVWDQVYTMNAIPVLSLAMCMVKDVVFPVNGKRCHPNCWAGALVANLLAALGVARLRVASRYAHPPRSGHAGFFECCFQGGCKEHLIPRVLWCLASGRRAVRGSQLMGLARPLSTC